ncbi:MAG: ABC transporter ATP-binding protein [Candidatus Auribacterota bacterium]|jgi:phospholipid/cholesterol/gamma-HCH transport system ATP-binding protein|uniref:ABC transporter ATP-binding protein n=1 Tax=Candidatus Auribacter fodinae TaxID=2093366 RepID=A0A3A4QX82_9BACT|nr:MAG: ABC transporter ATP-binding protein [Candidatus Auribacter fodinae]
MIRIENLIKNFGTRRILDSVTLEVKKGETMVIMGGSGCGKSTLLRHMIGLIRPDSGHIYIKDKDITGMSEHDLNEVRKSYGMLFQNGALLNSLTVGQNVALPLKEHTKLGSEIINIIVKMKLELVGLTGFENLLPSEISGGMKKRVGLARAIAMDPEMVFYDEPGAGLDPITAASIDQLIMDLSNKLGITSIVVTHEMKSAFRIADRMAVLYNGKVVAVGTPDEIRESDHPYVSQFINGLTDGPVPLRRSKDEYLKSLTSGD